MQKYYSPIKKYYKRKRIRLGYRLLKRLMRIFFPKDEFVWKYDKPLDNEPAFLVANHTKLYAPLTFILNYDKPIKVWSNAYFLFYKDALKHMFTNVLKNRKPKFLLYPLVTLLSPLIVWFFRSIEPIPVYRQSKKIVETFNKSVEVFKGNQSQVVFPEKLENRVNKYIFEFQQGFTYVGKQLYEETGQILKFYPTYVCQPLNKVLIGKPISYNPNIHMSKQKSIICKHLESQIEELGDSLPEHEIIVYE